MIGADLAPTALNIEEFKKGDIKSLLGDELLALLEDADYRIFNLERPLTDTNSPILKWGPCLSAPSQTITAIKKMDITLFTLANNHIMDHGVKGLEDTCMLLSRNNIKYVGVGKNIKDVSKTCILEKDGIKVGIYVCVEHEFSTAEEEKAGANPFDPLETPDHIADLKNLCDYVIVLYHGGKEFYRYPSPSLQKVCRKLVEKGADLILTQHSHCIGAMETYLGKKIIYGQGNFLYVIDNHNDCWKSGLLIGIEADKHDFSIEFYPVVTTSKGIRMADNEEKKHILEDFNIRSEEIKNDKLVFEKYNAFADEMLIGYESAMLGNIGKSFLFCALNKISGYRFIRKIFSGKSMVALYNALTCEAHYELLVTGVKKRIE
jgi:poly-gamma-glutamate synthesis protein (capsule biosynthesis protein)